MGLPEVTQPDDPLVDEVRGSGAGGVLVTNANVQDGDQASALIAKLKDGGTNGPLLVAADEEPGRVRTIDPIAGFVPSARRLAAEHTVDEVRDQAATIGRQLAGLGVTVDLAPDADLDAGPYDGIIGDRSFSADPQVATDYALAWARGMRDAGVTPVVKHFPGHGRTTGDDHVTLPSVSAGLTDLQNSDLKPFAALIQAGAPAVMVANVAYDALDPDVPASMSPATYTLLRTMGFKGAAITDSIGMGAVNLRWDFGEAAVRAISAGADGVLATDGHQARVMRDDLVQAVESGKLSENRLDEAAARMAALAGASPEALTCRAATLPSLR